MSEVAEKTAEVVAENVEEAVDGVVETLEVVRNNPKLIALAGIVGLAAGFGAGYFYAVKKLGKQFDEQMVEEIAQAREFYLNLNKVDEDGAVLTPMDVMEQRHGAAAAAEALRDYQGRPVGPVPTEADLIAEAKDEQGGPWDEEMDEKQLASLEGRLLKEREAKVEVVEDEQGVTVKQETRNVFVDPTFDYEEEVKLRTEDKPYIITHDEFYAAELDYDTQSLTYYEEDDTLADEHDAPVQEVDKTVGDDHLIRFGTASKDKNIVFVRNDRLGIDYEITRSPGSYVDEVLGLGNEPGTLKHSDQRDRRQAFRRGDG